MKKICFLGAGNMAEAIISGVLSRGLFAKGDIIVSDILQERIDIFTRKFGIKGMLDNIEAVKKADIVVLSIKPQVMIDVLNEISGTISSQLIISIAAGITTEMIERYLPEEARIIRVMPNTPALVGKGVTAYCSGKYAKIEDEKFTERIMGAVGVVYKVEENFINAITALSGSGPAYVFYLAEAMIDSGIQMGLDPSMTYNLVVNTIAGAGELLSKTGEQPNNLRAKVTSKGGTTEAAINILDANNIKEKIKTAILAAEHRAKELTK